MVWEAGQRSFANPYIIIFSGVLHIMGSIAKHSPTYSDEMMVGSLWALHLLFSLRCYTNAYLSNIGTMLLL